jgi:guanyl-specific ribonuclease Sa
MQCVDWGVKTSSTSKYNLSTKTNRISSSIQKKEKNSYSKPQPEVIRQTGSTVNMLQLPNETNKVTTLIEKSANAPWKTLNPQKVPLHQTPLPFN